jgi:RNA polymerase sigma-70 factor, ECF subfamily
LEHAVGEASGGGTDVDAGEAGERDGPVFEGSLELEAAAADVFEVGAEEADDGVDGDWGAGLVDALLAYEDAAGEDEGLGSFARGGVALVDKELVEAKLFSAGLNGVGHQVDSGGGDNARNLHLYFQVSLMMVQAGRGLKGVGHVGLIWDKVTMVAVSFSADVAEAARVARDIEEKSTVEQSVIRLGACSMYRETGLVNSPPPSSEDDAGLLSLVQRGDEQAMATLFDRYSKVVYSVALRVLRDPASAEDVLQEIFMQIWRNPDSFVATRGSLGGWLAVVSRNRSIDALRRKRPMESVDDIALASNYNLADEAERNNMMEKARTVIHLLPVEQRKTLEMAFFDGLTHSEIAEMTGDPLGTVKTRIRSALTTLRKAFTS